MVARAWRPADGSGMRRAHARGQQERGTGLGQEEDDAWKEEKQEVGQRRRQSGGQGRSSARRQENRAWEHVREEEEEREGVRGAYLEISEISGTSR
jgi:hypothetical protein